MATYTRTHAYATLNESQLVKECVAAGLPVTDIQRLGNIAEEIYAITSRDLTSPEQTTLTSTVNAHSAAATSTATTAPTSSANYLINSHFLVDQRNRSGVTLADDSYTLDRWYILTQSAVARIDRVFISSELTGSSGAGAIVIQGNVTSQRFGMAQIIEGGSTWGGPSVALRGQAITLQAQIAAANGPVRFAILGWAGPRDAVISDIVNNWNSTTYTANNFFAGNVDVIAMGQTPASSSYVAVAATGLMGPSYNNLIVFFWSENILVQDTAFRVFQPALYSSPGSLPYSMPDMATELARCQRFCLALSSSDLGQAQQASRCFFSTVDFPTTMRAAPTLLSGSFSVNAGSAGTVQLSNANVNSTGFVNTAANWTTGALVSVSCILEAEL